MLSPSTNTPVLGKGTVPEYSISERLRDWLCGKSLMTLAILTFLCDCDLSEAPFGIDGISRQLPRELPLIYLMLYLGLITEKQLSLSLRGGYYYVDRAQWPVKCLG